VIQAVESVRREIVVPVSAERAFAVFTADMTSWWPSEHHIGSAPIEEIVIEPHEGGRWFTRHTDGSETSTGHVVAWEPGERLAVTWQIGADWRYHVDLVTTIEVRFVAEASDRTRVVLEHRDLDAYGQDAEKMRDTFDQPGAWDATLNAFAGAFAAS
jgi:uncharacterized protein YndB with AHSA1/START domain